MRRIISFNENWLFSKEKGVVSEVTLPHTFNERDGQEGVSMWRGAGRYEKKFTLTKEELQRFLYLEIGAASLVSRVVINGHPAAENRFPFSMYRVPLNDWVQEGENTLVIETDNSEMKNVYPQMADFSFYGGVYREVSLIESDAVHFDYMDNSRDGIFVSTRRKSGNIWEVRAEGVIVNEKEALCGTVSLSLTDSNTAISAEAGLELNGSTAFALTLEIEDPQLWQGCEDPHLYTARIQVRTGKNVWDEREIQTGFRKIQVTPDRGLFLNGRHMKLRGVARHQDFGGVGNAITKAQMDTDMALIKELGANSVRLSHYQHDDYFYALCDREGILVWAEVPFISVPFPDREAVENIEGQMERLVKQCRNHTAIYCWGVQNEITIAGESEEVYQKVEELEKFTKALDPGRYTAEANIYSVENKSPLNRLTELVGYNLYYGWYYKDIPDLQIRLDQFHRDCPDVPLLVTEYGVDTNPGLHSYEPSVKDYTEEYQLLFCDNAIRAFEERDFVTGSYVWNMADFGSANRDEGGKTGLNQKGLITIDRKLKKDAFYLYKAYWSLEGFVKLASSRFVNRHREFNDIVVLSNAVQLSLYVNGKLLRQTDDVKPMTRFEAVALSMGENEILVRGSDAEGNSFEDSMMLKRVEQPDPSYILPKKAGSRVANWFEGIDFTDAAEIELDDTCYSTRDKIGVLLKNERAKAVLVKYFGKMLEDPRAAMMESMTIDALSKLKNLGMPQGMVAVLNRELNIIKKD